MWICVGFMKPVMFQAAEGTNHILSATLHQQKTSISVSFFQASCFFNAVNLNASVLLVTLLFSFGRFQAELNHKAALRRNCLG